MTTPQTSEMSDEILERWHEEFLEMETTLTVYQLLVLMKIKAGLEPMGVFEPVWPYCTEERQKMPLYKAPLLPESMLIECAQASALERLGLVVLENDEQEGACWILTRKGVEAVAWWSEDLREAMPTPEESAT